MADPISYLWDVELNTNKLKDAVLQDPVLSELVGNLVPGKFGKLPDGTPYYINSAGIPTPFDSNALLAIDGIGAITATTTGRAVTLEVALANAQSEGTISPEQYQAIQDLLGIGTDNLVYKDDVAGIQVTSVNGLSAPATGTSATNKDFVVGAISDAIAAIPAPEELNITGDSPFTITKTGSNYDIALELASLNAAGLLSSQLYALLNGATDANTANTLVKRGANGAIAVGDVTTGAVSATSIVSSLISGLSANPTGDSEATSKLFVESKIAEAVTALQRGMDFKTESVRAAINSNVALTSTAGTYDGVTVAVGQSILLIDQTDPAENGAYTRTANGLVRRADSNSDTSLTPGATYTVEEGNYAQNYFTLASPEGFILDTDPLSFINVSGVSTLIGGDGLVKSGQTLNVVGTAGRVTVNADSIDISATYDQEIDNKITTATDGLQDASDVASAVTAAVTPVANRVTVLENADYQSGTQVAAAITSVTDPIDARLTTVEGAYQNASQVSAAIAPVAARVTTIENADYQSGTQVDSKISDAVAPLASTASVTSAIATAVAPLQTAAQVQALLDAAIAPLQDELEVEALIASAFISTGIVVEKTFLVGDSSSTSFVINHGMNSLYPSANFFYGGKSVVCEMSPIDANSVSVSASLGGTPLASNSLRVVLQAKAS